MSKSVAALFGLSFPAPFRVGTPDSIPNGQNMFGIEFEVENCDLAQEDYRDLLDHLGIEVTVDHSLRGRAYEFITSPTELQYLLPIIREFYESTRFTEDNFTDRCSIHVHANVLDYTQEQLSSLSLVYQTVEEILFSFVGHDRDTNLYCIPWSHCRANHRLVEKVMGNPFEGFRHWQKYTALNLLPIVSQGTVEFRHMHGTADVGKLTTWINVLNSILCYVKKYPLEQVINTVNDLNTSSRYHEYFEEVTGGFLPYNNQYREALEDGVIGAKFSLMDWGTKAAKTKKKAPTAAPIDDTFPDEDTYGREEQRATNPSPYAAFFNTWGNTAGVPIPDIEMGTAQVVVDEITAAWVDQALARTNAQQQPAVPVADALRQAMAARPQIEARRPRPRPAVTRVTRTTRQIFD